MPVITDSVNKSITDGTTPYLFRIIPTEQVAAGQIVEYAFNKLYFEKYAIIYVNNAYSTDMKEYFRQKIRELGGEVTTQEVFFEGRTTDFTPELEKIKNSVPDSIIFVGYVKEAALIIRQARNMGITTPFISTDGISSEQLITLGGTAVEGIRLNGFFHTAMKEKTAQNFSKAFIERYGKEPDTSAALAYDAAKILIEAIRKNGASREGIYTYLTKLNEYPGVTGNITFDAKHDVPTKIIMLTVKDGKFVPDALQP